MQNVKDQEAKHKQIERTEQSIKHHYNVGGHGKNNTPNRKKEFEIIFKK